MHRRSTVVTILIFVLLSFSNLTACRHRNFNSKSKSTELKSFSDIPMVDQRDASFANIVEFLKNQSENTDDIPMKRFNLGPLNFVMMNDPKLIAEIFKNEARANVEGGSPAAEGNQNGFIKGRFHQVISNATGVEGTVTSKATSEAWQSHRAAIGRGFAKGVINNTQTQPIWELVEKELKTVGRNGKFKDSTEFDFSEFASIMSLKVVYTVAFGLNYADLSEERLKKVSENWKLFAEAIQAAGNSVPGQIFTSIDAMRSRGALAKFYYSLTMPQKYKTAIRAIENELKLVIEERSKTMGSDSKKPSDALGNLILAQRDGKMTADDVVAEGMVIIVAGHETTSSAMSWAVYQLAQMDPQSPERIQLEKSSLRLRSKMQLGEFKVTSMRDEDLLPFKNLVSESLRLYPSVYMTARETTKEVQLGGYSIPKGVTLLISPLSIQRSSASWGWGSTRLNFDSRRFDSNALEASTEVNSREANYLDKRSVESKPIFASYEQAAEQSVYLPFGGGVHECPGQYIANIELISMMALFHSMFQYDGLSERSANILPIGGVTLTPSKHVVLKNFRLR